MTLDELDNTEVLESFLSVYPEFEPLYTTQKDVDRFNALVEKQECLYPYFANFHNCPLKYPFFMLLAHTIVMSGGAKNIGILPSSGIKSGSSVGDVSVSFQATPYDKDNFSYWLSLTSYGREYLAYLQTQIGMVYVN